ncbi:collagen alpha-3(VI) chain isoform X2 [Rhinatrema bivittatum]|uniref:collagen alpha-3(VI) chain isoform X2 n=1 Tax=Rhinatrema bivittatum TaxID=194408 RepID=UPI00112C65C7|nr:collagen alpha-3(VI) chain isoform X2 [Rhinatrema bivittatum]
MINLMLLEKNIKMRKHRSLPLLASFFLLLSSVSRLHAQQDDKNGAVAAAADIIFLVDSSWSIGKEHFQQVREFLYNVVKRLDIGGNDFHFALIQYSGNPHTEFKLNTYKANQDILFHIWNMPYMGGGIRTGKGLEYLIKNHLTKQAGSRASDGVPQVIVVLTDRRSEDNVGSPSSVLKSADVNMFAVGVQNADEGELKEIASTPFNKHVFNVENFNALHGIVGDLARIIYASVASEVAGAKAAIKDITAQESTDLVFLIDGSNNVGHNNFLTTRDFLVNLIERLSVGEDQIRVGVVQYSSEPRTEFMFKSYTTKADVLDAVKALSFKGGEETNIGAALNFVLENHFIQQAGSRKEDGVPQSLVLISAGKSSDDLRDETNELKQASIFVFGIGAGKADTAELQQVASDDSFVFVAPDFRVLGDLQDQLLPYIAGVAQRTILLQPPTIITEVIEVNKRDIVFLIDGTAAMGSNNFAPIREFIGKIVQRLEIGPDLIQVAVAQYSSTVKPEFFLNTYSTKKDVVANVKKIKLLGGGPLNTGAALDYVRKNFFVGSAGSRIAEGVPQLLVLFTGGQSRDDIFVPANELKRSGILAFSIGAKNADPAELQEIAFDSSLVFTPAEFRTVALQGILPLVLSPLRTLSGVVIMEGPTEVQVINQRDIIFLLDGSVNVGNANAPFVRNFLVSLINNLDVGKDKIRIGVAQYSDTPKTEFLLDAFSDKSDVLARVGQLRLKGGTALNIGAALQFALENLFTEAGGSRINENVPQILVLLAAGGSDDPHVQASNALARAGILTFCVGVRNAEKSQLEQIAFNPSMVYLTDDFSSLITLPQEMIKPLTTYVSGGVEEIPLVSTGDGNKKDIVFLLDSSDDVGRDLSLMVSFMVSVVENLDVGQDKVRIAVVQYSDDAKVNFYLNTHSDRLGVLNAIRRLSLLGGSSLNTGAALNYVTQNIFTSQAGSRAAEGVPQFLILLTAGKSRDDVRRPSAALKTGGVVPFAIGAKNADIKELQTISLIPDFAVAVPDFDQLKTVEQQISQRVNEITKDNVITLIQSAPSYSDANKKDIVFLLDGSEDVRSGFPALVSFLLRVVENLDVGRDRVRIAVVQYSDDAKVNFYLDTYSDRLGVLNAIRRLSLLGGSSLNTGAALEYVTQNVFTRQAGSRAAEGVPQFLILLTAGKSEDDVRRPSAALKTGGVVPFAIGAKNADVTELQTISLNPDFVIAVPDFDQLETVQQQISQKVTELTQEQVTTLIQSIPQIPSYSESKRDILFMIDGSSNLAGLFIPVRDFLYEVINDLSVGPDATRVSVAQYSDNVKEEFKFNTYSSKDDILNHVRKMRLKTGRTLNTGAALAYAKNELLTKDAGSRIEDGVPQFLVLLSGGRSRDSTEQQADALKRANVFTFAIKARNADAAELERIVLTPKFILPAEDLNTISNIRPELVNLLKIDKIEVIEVDDGKRKDVVFLVDGSDAARSGFPSLRTFVQRIVENLDVGHEKVRVGVIQYSDDARPDFLLNKFGDKQEVLRAVQNLSPVGGSPLNTGAALNYVTQNVFTSSAGSRAAEGVPQFLILLTTGKSRDDVRRPSATLKTGGVVPFAVGARNADITELQTISLVPDLAVSVPNFNQLESARQKISQKVDELNKAEIDVLIQSLAQIPGDKRDVVFLIDGSKNAGPEFSYIRDLIRKIVENLDVSFENTRVSVVQFSEDPKVEFLLNTHSTKDDVQSAVRKIVPIGGRVVNTGKALDYVSKNIFTRPSGSRIEDGVPQFLILLSSGTSDDDVDEFASQIKQIGVAPFMVGKNVDSEETRKISLNPEYAFSVSSFQELPVIQQQLLTPISTLSTQQIQTILATTTEDSLSPDGEKQDIVFLIDSSDNVGPTGLPHIRDFILKVVQNLDVGQNRVRIGILQFSNDVFPEFLLNAYKTKSDVLQHIRRLRFKGGSPLNTGKALDHAAKNFFVKSAGSRIEEGVPQQLVLLMGGRSQDDVSRSAQILRDAGIRSLGVGAKNADRTQVESITSDPQLSFIIRDFKDLPVMESILIRAIEKSQDITPESPLTPSVDDKKQADIVFLVDGSINLGKDNFEEVLKFVYGIVDAVYSEGDSIQVGLAQYNSDVTDEFFLKDYSNRERILDEVSKVGYKGGRSANTGAAIKHLDEKHFIKEAGSRIDQGVPQIAFIITGGKSADNVEGAVQSLGGKGVNLFAIGLKDIVLEEVTKLASNSATALRVPNVQELSELNEQILTTLEAVMHKKLCPGIPEVSKDCNLDVIVGFDVSDISAGQNMFAVQRGMELKVKNILERISQMEKISCTSAKAPLVRVAVIGQSTTGPMEAFDFAEFRDELFDKFQRLATRGPYVLTAKTLQTYANKFATASDKNSVKVVIHLTDGIDDGMAELQVASTALKNSGVNALLFVGLEKVPKFEEVMQLEFGRGFTYNRPLRLNLLDLDFEIAEQLDNIAEKACCGVPCKCSGQRGDRGALGAIGPQGLPGEKGHRGFPGEEGGVGERGPPGLNGTQGFQGCPGQRGTKGSRGFPGEKGEQGEMGLDGINGEDGDKGIAGLAGDPGSFGSRGERGTKGEGGERGDSGLRGDPGEPGTDNTQRGPRGIKGEMGPVGEAGEDGPPGTAGNPGKKGGVSRRGPLGVKGNPGPAGSAGSVGEQGTRGPQGPPGPLGTPGVRGEQGSSGPRGVGGTSGPVGDRGKVGSYGAKGEPGDPGNKGPDGPPGPRGETGDDGRDGIGGLGPKGKKGEMGFPGYPGPKGASGDQSANGEPGQKGNRGRRGNAGEPGTLGQKGERGYPGPSGLKGDRGDSRDKCALVKNIKDKCPCCSGPLECPVYPTELVFAMDTSLGVNQDAFNRMKQAVLRILNPLTIAESNCPRGARASVVTYNTDVTTEIRFADSKRKSALIQQIENLQVPQSSKARSLENIMSFVARHTFKRARSGFLVRKVAVFFSNGPAKASPQLNEAVLKLYDAGVFSVFLVNRDDRALSQALQINNTGMGQAIVLAAGASQFNETIKKVLACHVCLDVCDPDAICGLGSTGPGFRDRRGVPTDADIDIAFIVDSSYTTTMVQFAEIKKYISHVVGQLEVSSDPKTSDHHARVAILQHAPYEYYKNSSMVPVKVDMSFTEHGSKEAIQDFIHSKMSQLNGAPDVRSAIAYAMENMFENVPNPRNLKVIVLLMTGQVNGIELELLQNLVTEAKCKGFFFVVLGIGKKVNVKNLYSLASEPYDVFFKRVDKPSEMHEEPLLRFGQQLPAFISSENALHLSPEIRKQCDWFQSDQPLKFPLRHAPKQMPNAEAALASKEKPVGKTKGEIYFSDVSENSVKVHWVNPEPQNVYTYNLTITSASDPALILKQSISGTESVIGGLKSGHQYHVTITGYHNAQAKVTYFATFSTKIAQSRSAAFAAANLFINSDPLDTPDTAAERVMQQPLLDEKILSVTDICKLQKEEGTCREYVLKWYYDPQTKSCARFWYGGCGGNDNRFSTQKECEKTCIPAQVYPGVITAIGN